MRNFKSKKEIFNYLKEKILSEDVLGIAVVGSTSKGKIKEFSDLDVVVFNSKKLKPYYELAVFNKKIFLISVYFYGSGKKMKLPYNGVLLYGDYFEQIEHKGNTKYNKKERLKRDNQMFVDMLFKYIRHKETKLLDVVGGYFRG